MSLMGAMRNISGLTYIKPKLMRKTLIITIGPKVILSMMIRLLRQLVPINIALLVRIMKLQQQLKKGKKLLLLSPEVAKTMPRLVILMLHQPYMSVLQREQLILMIMFLWTLYQLNSKKLKQPKL